MNRGKFIMFLLLLNFALIKGDKDKNLTKLQRILQEQSDSIDSNIILPKNLGGPLYSDIIGESDKFVPNAEDIPLPDTYIFGFTNYEFFENPYKLKYDIILRIANYPSNEIDYITKKVDIVTRNKEEEEVTCLKTRNISLDIYRFACSKEVNEPVSQISYVNNSIVLNGKFPLNASSSEISKFMGKNIQLQTKNFFSDPDINLIFFKNCYVYGENNKLLIEGETYGSAINSDDSTLSFVQEEDIKNIICNIKEENNNTFKMACNPNFDVNSDLSNNNMVYIDDAGKNGMLFFEEGKSFAKLNLKIIRKSSSSKNISKVIILVIIILSILLIVTFILIVFWCKRNNDSSKKNQKNNVIQQPSLNNINQNQNPVDISKEKTTDNHSNL